MIYHKRGADRTMKKPKNFFPRAISLAILFLLLSYPAGGIAQATEAETINLSSVIEKVLANSPEILKAKDAVETAKLNLSSSASQNLSPEVTLSGNWPIINSEDTNELSFGVTIEDAIYLFDESPTEKTTQILLQEAESQLFLKEEEVKAQAISYYLDILNGEKDYSVAQKTVELYQTLLEDQKRKWEEGNASSVDLLKAQENLENAKSLLQEKERELKLARENLNHLMGVPLDSLLLLTPLSAPSTLSKLDYSSLSLLLQERSSDKETLQLEKEKKEIEKEETQKTTQPQIALVGEYQGEDFQTQLALDREGILSYQIQGGSSSYLSNSSYFSSPESWGVGLEVSWKIWDGKVTSNQLKAADIEISQIEREMEMLPQTLSLKVETAVNQLLQAQSNRDLTSLIQQSAQDTYTIMEQQLQLGFITDRELLQSELQYQQAEINYQKAENTLWQAIVNLLQTLEEPIQVEENQIVIPSFLS